ncbi:MAG: type II secretion system protein GspD [Phycisphaera sp.]|nr:type II secretion system protein GspD [Phycisphaera sp.]
MTTSRTHTARSMIAIAAVATLTVGAALTPSTARAQAAAADTKPAAANADAPKAPAAADGDGIWLNFRDTPVDTVLEHLSEVAGVVIVKDAALGGRVTVISKQKLSVAETLDVLNSVLKAQGFAAVKTGRTLKIVKLADAKKANIAVRVGAEPEEIPETDEVVTQIVPIKNVEAGQLMKDINGLISDYAEVSANAGSNALIITDTSANIRRLVKIVAALDKTVSAVSDVRVVPLKYARAQDAARLVNEIFGQNSTSSSRSRSRGGGSSFFFSRFGGGPPGSSRGGDQPQQTPGRVEAPISASADERTNTVVISGPPETLDIVAGVLKDLDSNPAAEEGVFVYHVLNGQAANLETVLSSLFGTSSNRGGSSSSSSSDRIRPGTTGRSSSDTRRSTASGGNAPGDAGGDSRGGDSRGGDTRGGGGDSRGGGDSGGDPRRAFFEAMQRGLSQETAKDAADLVGQVYVVADEDTNSLLVMTSPTNFPIVKSIIEQLDKAIPQVFIKVLIAEVTHSDDTDLGVEFTSLGETGAVTFGTDFGIEAQLNNSADNGGMVVRVTQPNITATIRALQEQGKLEIISRPYILASDNQEAMITIGQEVPFIRNTRTTETGQTINTIQYDDVGIILTVTPHINPDGLVTMEIDPEISAVGSDSVPISESLNAPVIVKRSAHSRVAIQDGQTIVIGGLMEDRNTTTESKTPILGDIPLLGWLFKREQKGKAKTELLIFLTPHVAKNTKDLNKVSDEEKKGVEVLPDAVGPGVYQRHLEGMQRGGNFKEREQGADAGAPGSTGAPKPVPSVTPNTAPRPAPNRRR